MASPDPVTGGEPARQPATNSRVAFLVRNLDASARRPGPGARQTSLIELASRGDAGAVGKMLRSRDGVVPNARLPDGRTALSEAVLGGHNEVVRVLLDNGADPDMLSASGMTPLGLAALRGQGRITDTLLRGGADVNLRSRNGNPALMEAALTGRTDVVERL